MSDAFATPGLQLDLSTAELTALDVVGWNVAVPEPTSVGLFGFAASALLRRRRNPAV